LNPAPVENPQALEAWRPLAPVITPNEIEAAALTGLSRRAAPESLARHLIRNGFPRGVITLGDQGCLWWEGTRMGQRPARRVTAVDCVGAGDSFNAGLLHGLLAGRSLASACDVAQACSAKTVSRAGTAVALPVLGELPKSLR